MIDPQNDFCDLPENYRPFAPDGERFTPALPVAGAHADMQRLAALIDAGRDGLGAITVTLDSHQYFDIAHPSFWVKANGDPVSPFTTIEAAAVRANEVLPRDPALRDPVLAYLDALAQAGRYTHMVWPTHCEIGSWGHNIQHDLHAALNRWEEARAKFVTKVTKGENPMTEHYSALQAEVPVTDDPATQLNQRLLARLRRARLWRPEAGRGRASCRVQRRWRTGQPVADGGERYGSLLRLPRPDERPRNLRCRAFSQGACTGRRQDQARLQSGL